MKQLQRLLKQSEAKNQELSGLQGEISSDVQVPCNTECRLLQTLSAGCCNNGCGLLQLLEHQLGDEVRGRSASEAQAGLLRDQLRALQAEHTESLSPRATTQDRVQHVDTHRVASSGSNQ